MIDLFVVFDVSITRSQKKDFVKRRLAVGGERKDPDLRKSAVSRQNDPLK